MPKRSSATENIRLRNKCSKVCARLKQSEDTLHAIYSGQVDAIMIASEHGNRVQTLEGADSAYRTLIENMNEGIVTIASDGVILYSNRRFSQIINVPLPQIISSNICDWIDRADLPQFSTLKRRAPSGTGRGELTLKSGSVMIPVQLSINAVRINGKNIFSCIVSDLTEKKLALLVLEQASEAIVVCNEIGNIIRASGSAAALYHGDLLGLPFSRAFPLHLADARLLGLAPVLHGERLQCEATLERGAKLLHFLINAGPLSSRQPDLLGAIITMTDITARKEAEQALVQSVERYRSLTLATTQIIWSTDPHGMATDDNLGWRSYTGQSIEESKGGGWMQALHPDDVSETIALWRYAVETGSVFSAQYRLRRHDGAYRYHSLRGVPVRASDGSIREWVGTATDIHEQFQTQKRMLLEHGVARLLAESTNLADTMRGIIQLICDTCHWRCGIRWSIHERSLHIAETWCSPTSHLTSSSSRLDISAAEISEAGRLAHEVMIKKEPIWLAATDKDYAATPGVPDSHKSQASFSLPLMASADVVGALCFLNNEIEELDQELMQTATTIGRNIGLFLQRKKTEGVLLLRNRALEASTEAVLIARSSAHSNLIEYVNPAFEKMSGYSAAQVLGKDFISTQQKLCRDQDLSEIKKALQENRAAHVITHNFRLDNSRFWSDLHIAPVQDEHGNTTHVVGIQNDISESMRYQSRLEYQANHDALTGLPNRNLLHDRLQRAISSAQRNENLMALVFVDLDHFKLINDTLGHDVGDIVLKSIAARLTSCLRDADTAARPGGDEFLLILVDQESLESISAVIRRILKMIALPIPIDGRILHVTCSIGISIYLQDGNDVSTLLKNADTAMYHAKERGRNNFQFFNSEMNLRVNERFRLESSLREALEDNTLALHYQPQIDLHTGVLIGMEALLRWDHPTFGMIPPSSFIPIAEESGLIIPLGEWVLRTACTQAKRWQDEGHPLMTMAVNLSARQFKHDNLEKLVTTVLAETGLEAQYLELELTESIALENSEKFMQTLTHLKAMGLQLALDDFGTGYSSLSYLKNLPLDRLKIDMSFVHDMANDTGDAAIARIIIMLGHSLHLKVIAEGVETKEQLSLLREQGCDEIQGFFCGEPLPVDDIEKLLHTGSGNYFETGRLAS